MNTYKLTVDNCCSAPSIKAIFDGVPHDRIQRAFDFAKKAFRQVDATAEETGEIILSYYADEDWFWPAMNCGEALDILSHICYDAEW